MMKDYDINKILSGAWARGYSDERASINGEVGYADGPYQVKHNDETSVTGAGRPQCPACLHYMDPVQIKREDNDVLLSCDHCGETMNVDQYDLITYRSAMDDDGLTSHEYGVDEDDVPIVSMLVYREGRLASDADCASGGGNKVNPYYDGRPERSGVSRGCHSPRCPYCLSLTPPPNRNGLQRAYSGIGSNTAGDNENMLGNGYRIDSKTMSIIRTCLCGGSFPVRIETIRMYDTRLV